MKHAFTASVILKNEDDVNATVEYDVTPGFRGSYLEPPEPAEAEVLRVIGADGKEIPEEALAPDEYERLRELAEEHSCEEPYDAEYNHFVNKEDR